LDFESGPVVFAVLRPPAYSLATLRVAEFGADGAEVLPALPAFSPKEKVKLPPVLCGCFVRIGWTVNGGGRGRTDGAWEYFFGGEFYK